MAIRDELQKIYDQHGQLTPELVVAAARPKNHPLHDRIFDVNQAGAAERYYHDNAHRLIQSVRVVIVPHSGAEPLSVRAYHAVPNETEGHAYTYEPVEKVQADPTLRAIVLRDMEREWQRMRARYEHFEEFLALAAEFVAETNGH